MNALVSVVIPAYNANDFILNAIRSVYLQTYEPIEIIMVDDGSSDDTAALVAREYPNVKIIQQQNAGVAAARNKGLLCSRGKFVCLLDSDDGWFAGKLNAQIEHLRQNPNVGLVFHDWLVSTPNETRLPRVPTQPFVSSALDIEPELTGWIYHKLLLDCAIQTSTVMIRRDVVESVGVFDTNLSVGEDYDYWLRISRKYEIHKLRSIYSYYQQTPGSLTKLPRKVNYELKVLKNAITKWGVASPDGSTAPAAALNSRLAKLAFDWASAHYRLGSMASAHSGFREALKYEPWKFKTAIYYLLSLFLRSRG